MKITTVNTEGFINLKMLDDGITILIKINGETVGCIDNDKKKIVLYGKTLEEEFELKAEVYETI